MELTNFLVWLLVTRPVLDSVCSGRSIRSLSASLSSFSPSAPPSDGLTERLMVLQNHHQSFSNCPKITIESGLCCVSSGLSQCCNWRIRASTQFGTFPKLTLTGPGPAVRQYSEPKAKITTKENVETSPKLRTPPRWHWCQKAIM